jgi:putative transcriptional regulator
MITINIQRIAQIMGIQRPYSFLVSHGFTPQTSKDLLAGRIKRLDLRHLEKLCRIFGCEPYDLMDYAPEKKKTTTGPDPLAFLTKAKPTANIHTLAANLSLKEMEALLQQMAQRQKAA